MTRSDEPRRREDNAWHYHENGTSDRRIANHCGKNDQGVRAYKLSHPTLPSHSISRMPAYRLGGNREDIPLFDVTSRISRADVANLGFPHSKHFRKLPKFVSRAKASDLSNVILRQFRLKLAFAPSLADHVMGIVFDSAKSEMVGVHARRIITGMQDDAPRRYRLSSKALIGDAVGSQSSPVVARNANESITVMVDGTVPNPTPIGFFDLVFESAHWFVGRVFFQGSGAVRLLIVGLAKSACSHLSVTQQALKFGFHIMVPCQRNGHDIMVSEDGQ